MFDRIAPQAIYESAAPSIMSDLIDPALSISGHQRQVPLAQSQQMHGDDSQLLGAGTRELLQNEQIATERAQTWTGLDRFAFNAMLAAPDYKNKLRLKTSKQNRIVYFLTTPDAKSREKDRSDAQAKHQAGQWIYQDGHLFRRESRLQRPRRHVSANEVFDILTAEHLQSGHQGRDKMLKILETKYIGYTKDELMFVLDRCSVCSSKQIRGAAARRREGRQSGTLDADVVSSSGEVDPSL